MNLNFHLLISSLERLFFLSDMVWVKQTENLVLLCFQLGVIQFVHSLPELHDVLVVLASL